MTKYNLVRRKKKFKYLSGYEMPREKILKGGLEVLDNHELLMVLLGSGIKGRDVSAVAKELFYIIDKDFYGLDLENIKKVSGIGTVKACQILAAIEFARRYLIKDDIVINNCDDVYKVTENLKFKNQEHFVTLTLNGAGILIKKRVVFIGTLNQSLVHPREIYADAIADRAASIVFVHNHPSGSLVPSEEDIFVTNRLLNAGKLLGITVVDHIIIGRDGYYSFYSKGLIE